jgi:hypothetical protein
MSPKIIPARAKTGDSSAANVCSPTPLTAVRQLLPEMDNRDCSDEMIYRYLRATGGDLNATARRLRATTDWYRRERPTEMFCPACPMEPCSHYMHVACRDLRGRPVIYSCMELACNKAYLPNLHHCIATLEKCIHLMPEGETSWSWVLDFTGFTVRDVALTPLAKTFLSVTASHYPERLGHFWVIDAPSVFSGLWRAVSPLIDPKTREKIAFLPGPKRKHELAQGLKPHFDEETLAWLIQEMEDCRLAGKGKKHYDYGAVLKFATEKCDEDITCADGSTRHCHLGAPAFLDSLRQLAKAQKPLPPQYARHAKQSSSA